MDRPLVDKIRVYPVWMPMSGLELQTVRRQQVGEAVLRLAAREGLDGVSVRKVAAEAGCSPGAVQKYFATRDAMLFFALELAGERTWQRLSRVEVSGPLRDVVHAWLLATLPLDDERRAEARVWLEFAARASSSPAFATVLAEADATVRRTLSHFLQAAGDAGALLPGLPGDAVAHLLVALCDGLAVQLLYDPDQAPAALHALDAALTVMLPP